MNIKNRLKKIESELVLDSAFCCCEREVVFRILPNRETAAALENCETCGKEISQRLCTFNFGGNVKNEMILLSYNVIEPGDEIKENIYEF